MILEMVEKDGSYGIRMRRILLGTWVYTTYFNFKLDAFTGDSEDANNPKIRFEYWRNRDKCEETFVELQRQERWRKSEIKIVK